MAKDIALTDNDDLLFENGDLIITEADNIHIEHILKSEQGYWKQHPLIGAGIRRSLNGFVGTKQLQNIRIQLQTDGFKVNEINYIQGKLIIEAEK